MRKKILASLCFLLAISTVVYGATPQKYSVVPLHQLTQQMAEDFCAGKTPDMVLECTEGAIFPFSLSLKSDFLSLDADGSAQSIAVVKTCFIRSEKDMFFFSTDLCEWKKFEQFFTGMTGISLNLEEQIPTVYLNFELNQRG